MFLFLVHLFVPNHSSLPVIPNLALNVGLWYLLQGIIVYRVNKYLEPFRVVAG